MSANEYLTKMLSDAYSPVRNSILSHLDLESMLASIKAFPEWTEGISSSKIFQERVDNTTLIDSCTLKTGGRLTSEYLINQGADVNIINKAVPHWSALHYTVLMDDAETCQMLVSAGANVNITDNSESTPLHIAGFDKNLELCQILISGGADLNFKDFKGKAPLHWAALANDVGFVQLFISAGADVNIQDQKGRTPLHHVTEIRGGDHSLHKAMVDLLIQHGADPKLKDTSGDTPIKNCRICQEKYIT